MRELQGNSTACTGLVLMWCMQHPLLITFARLVICLSGFCHRWVKGRIEGVIYCPIRAKSAQQRRWWSFMYETMAAALMRLGERGDRYLTVG